MNNNNGVEMTIDHSNLGCAVFASETATTTERSTSTPPVDSVEKHYKKPHELCVHDFAQW